MTFPEAAESSAPDLSVVIVTWNVRDLALSCLQAIRSGSGQLVVEPIVVDNGSTDGTVEAIREAFPEVLLTAGLTNIGFARATNQGISIANGRHVLLLNPDAMVGPGVLERMVALADAHPDYGIVGPQLVGADGSLQAVCARPLPKLFDWWTNYAFAGHLIPRSRLFGGLYATWWDHQDSRPVEAVCGACMLISATAVAAVGLLDESVPMYLEDLDYCARVKAAGLTTYYDSAAVVVHHQGQSSRQALASTAILALTAMRVFFGRYSGDVQYRLFPLTVAAAQLVRLSAVAQLFAIGQRRRARELAARELAVLRWALRGSPVLLDLPAALPSD
jgi:N-acetylglucosaminyl-diphospho-decaprenol L-rhamnosyltransferase